MGFSLQKKKAEEKPAEPVAMEKEKKKRESFLLKLGHSGRKKEESPEEYTVLGEKKLQKKETTKEESGLNPAIVNILSPYGAVFEKNGFDLGENKACVMAVVKYPSEVDYGWLSNISNLPGTVFSADFQTISGGDLLDDLNSNIRQAENLLNSSNDHLERQRLEVRIENAKNLMYQIDQNGEKVGLLTIAIMPYAPKEGELERALEKLKAKAASSKLNLRKLAFAQKEGYMQISPFHEEKNEVADSLSRICPLSSFIGGFPFSASGYSDGSGYYLAKDLFGGLVILDLWKRENDRTNSNFVLTGVPGVGKSTAVKHIIVAEYMKGTKIIIIDPEAEYRELTKKLGGDIINAGGGRKARINPLQVRPAPKHLEEEEEDIDEESDRLPDLAAYLNMLETFFQIYLKPSEMEMALLKDCILSLYKRFHITWETDITKLSNQDFPVMSDLYEEISLAEKTVEDRDKKRLLLKLKTLLKDAAEGKDAFLWNGYSTDSPKARVICFDTSGLGSMNLKTKTAQYFNITSYCWQMMSADKEEKVMLICDEAYLLIDPDVPQTLSFIRDVEKRDRKYNAGLGIISHSIVDFLDEKVKRFGQAVLDLPAYKFLMGTDGQNLKETKMLYNLTEAEELFLEAKQRKRALAFIGSKRLPISFDIPSYKLDYFGSAGGK